MNAKPVSLEQVDTDDYTGPAPQPLKVVGGIPVPAKAQITALTPLGTSGTSTVGQIETAVNSIIAALKA